MQGDISPDLDVTGAWPPPAAPEADLLAALLSSWMSDDAAYRCCRRVAESARAVGVDDVRWARLPMASAAAQAKAR
jgi:hypothetical protein